MRFKHLCVFLAGLLSAMPAAAADDFIILQSTTSTQNSGLYNYLLPHFEEETGIEVRVVAVGTGQAIRNAQNGDGDVLIVHATAREEAFVADGFGEERFDLMYNDFVIIGPKEGAVSFEGVTKTDVALQAILESGAIFVSRGDDSGTHIKERSLWAMLGVEPVSGDLYREVGSGMGATIRATIEMQGYTLSDRATWLAYENKQDYEIVFEGDPPLFNQYGILSINTDLHPYVKAEAADLFIKWMLSPEGQGLIASYQVQGQQLFFPNAK